MNSMENEKQIGLVKWFHDKSKDSNYGFIQHIKLGDLYFNENSIDIGQDIHSFRENAIVIFKAINQETAKHRGKLKAIEVKYLENETNLFFLFNNFLIILSERGKYTDYNIIQKGIHERISLLIEKSENDKTIEQLYEKFLVYLNQQINPTSDEIYLKGLLKVAKGFFRDNYHQITAIVEKNISVELAYKLWLESFIETCQIDYVAGIILSESEPTKQKIFSRCTENDFNQLFEHFIKHLNEKIHSTNITDSEFENILKVSKKFFNANYNQITAIIEKNISVELAYKLWLESFIETCQIDYIASVILSEHEQIQQKILNRCSENDKTNIFFKVLLSIDKIDTDAKLKSVKQLLSLSKVYASEQYEKVLAETIKNCPDFFILDLWLEDYHETLDFHTYKLYTVTLSPKDQKKFVKKVLKYIHEGRVNISIENLTSLNVMDFETSNLAKQIDNSKLDYSTSIILNVILELKTQTNLETRKNITAAQHRIYDLIIRQIKEPKDILHISGFFDECEGRCSVSVQPVKNEEGEIIDRTISYNRNVHNKAKNHPICDGRKAVTKLTKEPVLSDEGVEFWWCANSKCYKPSRQLHNSTDWEKYSLLDFLTILKVDFKESDLEIYLNIINKANRFLKHLSCRNCKHILFPKGKSAYAFYGVNNFICETENCSEKGKEIYLSHCLNGYCEMEIDSRDSVKCKPNGHEAESCGWYVCNNCHSCCSTKQLERRKSVHDNIMRTEYNCHLVGHQDLGIISCNKCGDSMEAIESNIEEYNRILNWFIENKGTSDRIHKSGKNKRDKWWFIIKRSNDTIEVFRKKLTKYYQIGFQIPDFARDKDLQLIAEPFDLKKHTKDVLTCKTCGNILDLTNNPEKARAVKNFHNVKFPNEKIK